MSNVYLIVGHKSREHLEDLFRYIWTPNHYYLIHIDKKAPFETRLFSYQVEATFNNVKVVKPRFCSWGGWSVTEVILDGMSIALTVWNTWDHFIPLTEHHLPLYEADECARRLKIGITYSQANRVVDMHRDSRLDALHRLEWESPELGGVGHFIIRQRLLKQEFIDKVYQGTACFILARDACEHVLKILSDTEISEIFRNSIQSDELAIQTALHGFGFSKQSLNLENPTFVAIPHVSGSPHAVFSEENFYQALKGESCFIRKRPDVLPEKILLTLENKSYLSKQELEEKICSTNVSFSDVQILDPKKFVSEVRGKLANNYPDAEIIHLNSEILPNVPMLEIIIRSKKMPKDTVLYLVSADMCNYKIVLMLWTKFDGLFEPKIINGQISHLLRVRVYDMFFNREISCPFDIWAGFGKFSSKEIDSVANHIILYLVHGQRMAVRQLLHNN